MMNCGSHNFGKQLISSLILFMKQPRSLRNEFQQFFNRCSDLRFSFVFSQSMIACIFLMAF
uniref:Secreted protein n=1 Tax=Parascaris univalens TaxID=6257 RepID=A0A915ASV0_PARUN